MSLLASSLSCESWPNLNSYPGVPNSEGAGEDFDLEGVLSNAPIGLPLASFLIGLKPRIRPESACFVVLWCVLLGCISERGGRTADPVVGVRASVTLAAVIGVFWGVFLVTGVWTVG